MPNKKRIRVLIAGISPTPETFLWRLICGLVNSGVEVTLGCPKPPQIDPKEGISVQWLSLPTWTDSVLIRLLQLAKMRINAQFYGASDLPVLRAEVEKKEKQAGHLRRWHDLLPFAGKRWDVIYFPWNSAAITYLPIFDMGSPVILSCRGTQVKIAPHNPETIGGWSLIRARKGAAGVAANQHDAQRGEERIAIEAER